jgi:exodeoxyribonuclease VII small subunit
MINKKQDIENLSYEEALKELERTIDSLESQEHALEEALSLFEYGQKLSSYCAILLNSAQMKVKKIENDNIIDFNDAL